MTKHYALATEARRWVGITEQNHDNSGQLVELFQKVIGGANKESWCMSFVQYCVLWMDKFFPESTSKLHKSESCLEVWLKTPMECRIKDPMTGSIVIWNYEGTIQGHCGIVIENRLGQIVTVEGNTSAGDGVDREGDGVFMKFRTKDHVGKMKILGYLDPWPSLNRY